MANNTIEKAYGEQTVTPQDVFVVAWKVVTGGHTPSTQMKVEEFLTRAELDAFLIKNANYLTNMSVYKAKKLSINISVDLK